MSSISKRNLLKQLRRGRESREQLVQDNLTEGIAFQIRATRDRRGWSQADLAQASEMTQNNVSRLESPEYGKASINTLRRLAAALDVALVVRFVPFSQYVDWLSGTPHLDLGMSPEAMSVQSFTEEEDAGNFGRNVRLWEVTECLQEADMTIHGDFGNLAVPGKIQLFGNSEDERQYA